LDYPLLFAKMPKDQGEKDHLQKQVDELTSHTKNELSTPEDIEGVRREGYKSLDLVGKNRDLYRTGEGGLNDKNSFEDPLAKKLQWFAPTYDRTAKMGTIFSPVKSFHSATNLNPGKSHFRKSVDFHIVILPETVDDKPVEIPLGLDP
jgi:hypothetical protein